MRKIEVAAAALSAVASLSAGFAASAAPTAAQPHPWDRRIKCQAKDPQGRKIVTRYGNADFGWQHFTGRHNISHTGPGLLGGITAGYLENEYDQKPTDDPLCDVVVDLTRY
jgi:hypothetical protein